MKTKIIALRLTPEQDQILQEKAWKGGFMQKSDYIRYALFMKPSIQDKIDQIHETMCKNG